MAKAKKFYQKRYSKHIGAAALLVASFLAEVFLSCGVPLGQLMGRHHQSRTCFTLWGYRPNCWSSHYEWRFEFDECYDRKKRFQTAEAFAVVGCFSLLFNLGAAWFMLCEHPWKFATFFIAIFSMASSTVPMAVITSSYYSHYCGDYTLTHWYRKYGAGFACICTSFALQGVGIILFTALEPDVPPPADPKKPVKSASSAASSASAAATEEDEE